jgi:hypothetical protein
MDEWMGRATGRRHGEWLALAAVGWLGAVGVASAQEGVAGSGMAQGQASVTTRSDVTISLESLPGTSGARIAVLGRGVTQSMPELRRCYGDAVAQRPATHGRLRLRLDVPATGATTSSVVEDAVGDAPLLGCIQRVLATLTLEPSLRPASAVVVMEFDNTAARGGAEVAARQAEADAVTVTRGGGRPEARGEGNAVRFVVRGAADASDEVVADALRVVRSQVPGLLDCRRRASRRGRDPEGDLVLTLAIRPGAAPVATAGRSTVADPEAPRCVATALGRAHRRPSEGPATLEVEIHFDR